MPWDNRSKWTRARYVDNTPKQVYVRINAIGVVCPTCKAEVGASCVTVGGERNVLETAPLCEIGKPTSPHSVRKRMAIRAHNQRTLAV